MKVKTCNVVFVCVCQIAVSLRVWVRLWWRDSPWHSLTCVHSLMGWTTSYWWDWHTLDMPVYTDWFIDTHWHTDTLISDWHTDILTDWYCEQNINFFTTLIFRPWSSNRWQLHTPVFYIDRNLLVLCHIISRHFSRLACNDNIHFPTLYMYWQNHNVLTTAKQLFLHTVTFLHTPWLHLPNIST